MDDKNTCLSENEIQQKKEWNAPELSIITTGKTWSGIGPFADGGLGSES